MNLKFAEKYLAFAELSCEVMAIGLLSAGMNCDFAGKGCAAEEKGCESVEMSW